MDRYYDAFNYYFLRSRMLSDIPAEENADQKDSGLFDQMRLCYGYNLTVKGTGEVVPDKAYGDRPAALRQRATRMPRSISHWRIFALRTASWRSVSRGSC